MKRSKARKALRIFLDATAAIALLGAIFSTFCYAFVTNANEYRASILTEKFDSLTMVEYKKCIESVGSIVEIDTQKVFDAVSTNEIEAFEHNYVITVITSIIDNKEMYLQNFSSQKLEEVINKEIKNYCDANKLEFKEEEAKEIYDYICGYIDSTLEFIPGAIMPYLKKAGPLFARLNVFSQLQLPLYFVALVSLVLNLSIAKKRHAKDVLFGSVSTTWIAITTFAVPIGLLALYNVPSKLVLSKNLFFLFVNGICDVIINKLAILLVIVLFILTVMLVIGMVLVNRKKKEEDYLNAYIDKNTEILNKIYSEKNS